MPQDHPPWKRGGAGPGCFTACFLWWHCFCCLPVSAWSVSWKGTKGKERRILTQQERKLTWLISQWVPGKIPKHCPQKLPFMIMIPGQVGRKVLNPQLIHNRRETNRALCMLPWNIRLLEGIQDSQATCKRHPQSMRPFVGEVKSCTDDAWHGRIVNTIVWTSRQCQITFFNLGFSPSDGSCWGCVLKIHGILS